VKLLDDKPVTRREADESYGALRRALLLSAGLMLVIGAAMAFLDFPGWQIYVAAVVIVEGISIPLVLRGIRRELDAKVRAGSLGEA
jgi:hypothetical protein